MAEISVSLTTGLKKKISEIAERSGKSMDEIISQALSSYVDEYEDIRQTDICSVDNFERSFFLSVGE